MLQKLVPRFLKRADQFLLKNHPVIWRTKIHFVAFYSLIVGNVVAVGLGLLYPVSMEEIPSNDTLEMLFFLSTIIAAFGLIWWSYSTYKVKLRASSFAAYLLTGFLYFAGTISIWFNVLNFNTAVQYQIANLVNDVQFKKDIGYVDSKENQEILFRGVEVLFQEEHMFERYQVKKPKNIPISFSALNAKLWKIYKAKGQLESYPNNALENHYNEFVNYYNSTYHLFYIFSLIGFLAIPFCLLLISRVKFSALLHTIFHQVLVLIGAIFASELVRFEPASSYSFLSVCLILVGLLTKGNHKWTIYLFSMMATMLGITLFISYMDQSTYRHSMYLTTMVVLGISSVLLSSSILYFMHRRIIKPKIN